MFSTRFQMQPDLQGGEKSLGLNSPMQGHNTAGHIVEVAVTGKAGTVHHAHAGSPGLDACG